MLAAGVVRPVGVGSGGGDVSVAAAGDGSGAGVRKEFVRAVDRERVLSEIRWTVGGGGTGIFARGPKVRKSAKSAGVFGKPFKTIPRGRGGAYSFVACLSHLTMDHASLSRR